MKDVALKTCIVLFALFLAPNLSLAQSPVLATAQTLDSTAQSLGQSLSHALAVQRPFDPATYKPLNAHERWHRMVREDGGAPGVYVESLGSAAYLQVFNSPSEWKGTTRGYLRRAGSSFATDVIQNSDRKSVV